MGKYKKAQSKFRSEKQSMKRALKQQIRDEWSDKQVVIDIEAQLSGLGFVDVPIVEASNRPRRPAQERLMDALMALVETTVEGQYQRRDAAINAVTVCCVVVEDHVVRRPQAPCQLPLAQVWLACVIYELTFLLIDVPPCRGGHV